MIDDRVLSNLIAYSAQVTAIVALGTLLMYALREQREIAYTTVMTMMGVLEKKGHLKKILVDRAHVFTPVKQQQEVVGSMVRDFVERVFDGASDSLLLALAKDNKLTPKQRRLVKKLIEEIDE